MQSSSAIFFLGMRLACFTALQGWITVSVLSAVLMGVFFVVLGVSGYIHGSFLLEKKRLLSVGVPTAVSSAVTLVMYIGEMILLSGHLYRFGSGFLFDGLGALVLAPIDILIILLSCLICALILTALSGTKNKVPSTASVTDVCVDDLENQ